MSRPLARLFALGCALALAAPAPAAEEPRIASVELEGAKAEALLGQLGIERGSTLDPRQVREAVRRLHATAQFSQVAAFVEDVPASELPVGSGAEVRLVFVVRQVVRLSAVSFPGRSALADSALHQTANLQVKSEYRPEALARAAEAIRAAYFRIGYRRVTVQPQAVYGPEGVALALHIDEGQPTRVSALRFEGDAGLSEDQLRAAFRLQPGDVLHLGLLDESVRSVRERYRAEGRLRARVAAPRIEEEGPGRARIVVPVEAGPVVRFHVRGNRAFTAALLLGKVGLGGAPDEPLDAQVAEEMASRLRRFYVSAGWFGARVGWREMRAKDGAVQMVFAVDEGHRTSVDEVRFEGNAKVPPATLRAQLFQLLRDAIPTDPYAGADEGLVARMGVMGRLPDPPPEHTRIEPERVFDPAVYARALRQMEDLYKSQGYLAARAGPPRLSPLSLPGHVAVTIPIAEGDRAVVSDVSIEGGEPVPARELSSAVTLVRGGAFSYLAAEEGRAALVQLFARRGHLYVRVDDAESFVDPGPGDPPGVQPVRVRYRVQPGPQVRVALVEVVGQRRTREDLIRDLVALKPGDVLTPEALDRGQQQLLRTGLFYSATVTPLNPEVPEGQKTLQISLRERPTVDVVVSGGFSLADGPRVTAQYIQGNLLGRNLTFSAVAKADYPFIRYLQENNQRCVALSGGKLGQVQCEAGYQPPPDPIERVLDLGLSIPRLSPLTDQLRAGIDLIHQRTVRASYRLRKYSLQLSTGLTTRRPFDLGVQYEIGSQELSHANFSIEDYLAGVDPTIFRQPAGTFLLGSLRPTATLDLRDDPGRPRSGFFAQVSGDYLKSLSSNSTTPIDLFKWQGLAAGYLPLPALSSLLLAARAGRILHLGGTQSTPGDRSFYLGGASTLRGFREDSVQPQDLVDSLHRQVAACQSTLSNLGCSPQVLALETFGTSDGGDQFLLLNVELRVPLAASTEIAFFYDAGNVWLQPRSFVSNLTLRDAAGIGFRYATPIGRIAIDLGVNLNPDPVLSERRFGPYFSINTL